jgi:hypothetical protein
MKIIQHADCFEVRSERGSIVKRFPFDDNGRRRAISRRMTRKQASKPPRPLLARAIRSKRRSNRTGLLRTLACLNGMRRFAQVGKAARPGQLR